MYTKLLVLSVEITSIPLRSKLVAMYGEAKMLSCGYFSKSVHNKVLPFVYLATNKASEVKGGVATVLSVLWQLFFQLPMNTTFEYLLQILFNMDKLHEHYNI